MWCGRALMWKEMDSVRRLQRIQGRRLFGRKCCSMCFMGQRHIGSVTSGGESCMYYLLAGGWVYVLSSNPLFIGPGNPWQGNVRTYIYINIRSRWGLMNSSLERGSLSCASSTATCPQAPHNGSLQLDHHRSLPSGLGPQFQRRPPRSYRALDNPPPCHHGTFNRRRRRRATW